MSSILYLGNSTYEYKEPDNFKDALRNLSDILDDKLEVLKNYLSNRREILEEGQRRGFASVSDFVTYRECQYKMEEIEARKISQDPTVTATM